MNSADVIGYVLDGCVLCPDCVDAATREDEETGAVFADEGPAWSGATCEICKCVWVDAEGAWIDRASVTDKDWYRWARCPKCNHQEPYPAGIRQYRVESRRGLLRCGSCGAGMRF